MVERTPISHRPAALHGERRRGAGGTEATGLEISTSPADLVGDLEVIGAPRSTRSSSGSFPDAKSRRRYWIVLTGLALPASGFAPGLPATGRPAPGGARRFH